MLINISFIFTFLSIFTSFINRDMSIIAIVLAIIAIGTGLIYLIKRGQEIAFPKNFGLMIIFVLILQAYLLFVENKTNPFFFALTFGEGVLYWLIFYNLKNGSEILKRIIINLTVIYALIFSISKIFNIDLLKISELLFENGGNTRHWDIGGLSAITLITIASLNWGKFNSKTIIIILINIALLAVSNVRSAFLSLGFGLGYLFYKKDYFNRLNQYTSFSVLILIVGLFIASSFGKTTLFDRPYFLQSITSLTRHPFGVGMGNFNQIAVEYLENGTNGTLLATTTHNIFLETLSGVGVFSIIFLIFLIYVFREVFNKNGNNVAWNAVMLTILVLFMFDESYLIPGFLWIIFVVLGVFQNKNELEE